MSILDDAIREHLELKRAHGADEAELKRLEDEAFGPPGRPEEPDPLAEAPTEFMTTPEAPEAAEPETGGRRINIADLQEPPPLERAEEREEAQVESTEAIEPAAEAAPLAPAEDVAQAAPPAEEELPLEDEPQAMEHEIVVEPAEETSAAPAAEAAPGEETQERHALAEQPTELFDIEAEMGTEDAPAAEPAAEIQASRTEPPAAPLAEDEDEEDEEFWSDQRLSDELDQALEAPLTDEHEVAPRTDVHEIPSPVADPAAPIQDEADEDEADDAPRPDYDPDTGHEDVLEDTPDFLEDAPEDDELWFEQKPPKDFDLD
jgi:heat shock protein HspQ